MSNPVQSKAKIQLKNFLSHILIWQHKHVTFNLFLHEDTVRYIINVNNDTKNDATNVKANGVYNDNSFFCLFLRLW